MGQQKNQTFHSFFAIFEGGSNSFVSVPPVFKDKSELTSTSPIRSIRVFLVFKRHILNAQINFEKFAAQTCM